MNEKLPSVAVLLAAYNGAEWLGEQIESILNQERVEVTIFISVDLSTDFTYEYLIDNYQNVSNIVLLEYGERFGGAGPNFYRLLTDVNLGAFDLVALSDQDDIWFHDKLSRAYETIQKQGVQVCSSNVTAFWSNGRELLIEKAHPQVKYDYLFEAAGPGCTYVFTREFACKLQEFILTSNGKHMLVELHDWLIYAFARSKGIGWFIDPAPSMLYRQHGNNQVGINRGISAYLKRINLIRSKWYRKQVESVVSIVEPSLEDCIKSRLFLIKNFKKLRRSKKDRAFLLLTIVLGIY
jgi:rhamnosyltransferase